ncbi:MAG: HlyD family efflux transporter periplasmic adaptor subunit [Rhodobacteraceae bacterium]|nr:HlyD family efflux transporter periplasmic adaptor subunit [Paracoccaceae bacterium]
MAARKKRSRPVLTLAAIALVAAVLAVAFWPRPSLVDMGTVRVGHMALTIDEEARTQVHEPYVVSSPVAGELQRVEIVPGDRVVSGQKVAEMRPANPAALDVRTREQARAAVEAAEAALRVARADLKAAEATRDYARSELTRIRKLVERGIVSQAALEKAEQEARVAEARADTLNATITMRKAEVDNALAQLIGFDDLGLAAAFETGTVNSPSIPIRAPIEGTILKVLHKSETALPAGEPILEIGNVERDLEVVAELLSSDAVRVEKGDRVIITNWGGPELDGVVARIDPYGFTKHSALGVEEQRVETIIGFSGETGHGSNLGHGYRVEVRIVVWERDDARIVPSSALFRDGNGWAVFAVRDGRAALTPVEIGRNNGIEAELLDGLEPGDRVVLFPSSDLRDGAAVAQRQVG